MERTDAASTAGLAERLCAVVERFARDSDLSLPAEGCSADTRLEADLGLDSLGRAELVSRIERDCGQSLSEEALLAATLGDLLALLEPTAASHHAERPVAAPASAVAAANLATHAGHPVNAGTLLEVLDWHCAHQGRRTHLIIESQEPPAVTLSYQALATGAARVAARLHRAGLHPGATVALMLPSGAEYFWSFMGVLRAGAVPVPIYPPGRPQQLAEHLLRHGRILDNAAVEWLVTVPEARPLGRVLRAQVPSLRGLLTLEGLDEEPAEAPAIQVHPHDMALLQYTSGSTGDPKGVILTHADLLANIRAMGVAIDVHPDDVFVSWLPLYHDMGLIGAWLGSLYHGVPLVSLSPLAFLARPSRWLEAISEHGGTLSAAPNFAYELCLTRIRDEQLARFDLRRWRWALNGAEPVSAQTLEHFAERFAPCGFDRRALAPVYGLAEAAVGLAFPPPLRGPRIDWIDRERLARGGYALPVPPGSPAARPVVACGRPLPGYRLRVVDPVSGQALDERHEGLLQFQGPSATQGYYRNPQATATLVQDGWHQTGDRAYLANGEAHLTGRVKDIIIRGGRNLYPYELEQALGEVPGVRKGCVVAFAAPDPQQGSERLIVAAETKERDPQRRASLERVLRERATAILGLPPDALLLVPPRSVPKTSSGKLRRGEARERYLAGRLAHRARPPAWQLLEVWTQALTARAARGLRALPRGLYGVYVWTLLALIAPWVWAGVTFGRTLESRWRVARAGIRWCRRLAGIRLTVSGREHWPDGQTPAVLIANHSSYLDGLILAEISPSPLRFVAKRELAMRPVLGPFLRRLGVLFVARFNPRRGSTELSRLDQALRRGHRICVFPEGTFREAPGLLPFHMGAFAAAARTGRPVIPILLEGAREVLPGEHRIPRPRPVRVAIGAPLIAEGEDWRAASRLRDRARRLIAHGLQEPEVPQPPASVPVTPPDRRAD